MTTEVIARLAAYRAKDKRQPKSESESRRELEEPDRHAPSRQERPSEFHKADLTLKHSWWITGLKILLWLLIWGFFIEVEFGAVYLVASGLLFIVLSLRGGRKREPGELSAYSVFNKNFEAIEGTLSAEQFEKELRYGPNAVQ